MLQWILSYYYFFSDFYSKFQMYFTLIITLRDKLKMMMTRIQVLSWSFFCLSFSRCASKVALHRLPLRLFYVFFRVEEAGGTPVTPTLPGWRSVSPTSTTTHQCFVVPTSTLLSARIRLLAPFSPPSPPRTLTRWCAVLVVGWEYWW